MKKNTDTHTHTQDGIQSRRESSDLKDRQKSSKLQQKVKRELMKKENRLRKPWDMKRTIIHIIGVLQERERKREARSLFKETIAEKFPKSEIDIQVQEVQRNGIRGPHYYT